MTCIYYYGIKSRASIAVPKSVKSLLLKSVSDRDTVALLLTDNVNNLDPNERVIIISIFYLSLRKSEIKSLKKVQNIMVKKA